MSFHTPPIRVNPDSPTTLIDADGTFFASVRDPAHAEFVVQAVNLYDRIIDYTGQFPESHDTGTTP